MLEYDDRNIEIQCLQCLFKHYLEFVILMDFELDFQQSNYYVVHQNSSKGYLYYYLYLLPIHFTTSYNVAKLVFSLYYASIGNMHRNR